MTGPTLYERRPCEMCDFIGPELDTLEADRRAAHRALHDFIQTVANLVVVPLLPVMEWFTEWTEARVRRSAMRSAYRAKTRRRR